MGSSALGSAFPVNHLTSKGFVSCDKLVNSFLLSWYLSHAAELGLGLGRGITPQRINRALVVRGFILGCGAGDLAIPIPTPAYSKMWRIRIIDKIVSSAWLQMLGPCTVTISCAQRLNSRLPSYFIQIYVCAQVSAVHASSGTPFRGVLHSSRAANLSWSGRSNPLVRGFSPLELLRRIQDVGTAL